MSKKGNKKLSPNFEDYLESILIIQEEKKVVRVKDISEFLDVSMPSVNGAIKELKKKGLVNHQKYGYVELTEEGEKTAREIFHKHTILKQFFTEILDVPEKLAAEDACKIEHYMSKKTLNRLSAFIKFVESCPKKDTPVFLDNFRYFIKHGKRKK